VRAPRTGATQANTAQCRCVARRWLAERTDSPTQRCRYETEVMCEVAAAVQAQILNACDAMAGLISASRWICALKIGDPPLGSQPKDALHLVPRHSAGEMWPVDPLPFTLASLLGHSEETTRLRVTADWAIMLRGSAVRSPCVGAKEVEHFRVLFVSTHNSHNSHRTPPNHSHTIT
jgi:hypothetical protein